MNNFSQKEIFKVAIAIVLIIGTANTAFSQTKIEAPSSNFLILVETIDDGLKLSGQEGCAWKELTFTLNQDKPQAIDQYGMTSSNRRKPVENKNLTNFLFIIKKKKEGISLEGKEGTAWLTLNFSCPNGKCSQYIDFNGMSVKD